MSNYNISDCKDINLSNGDEFLLKNSNGLVYPAIVQSTKLDYFELGTTSISWELVGSRTSKPSCGDYLTGISCPSYGAASTFNDKPHTRKIILQHCFRPACPICKGAWAFREANRAANRLASAEKLYHREGRCLGLLRHIVFSPPQEWAIQKMVSVEGFKELKKELIKIAKKCGVIGGMVVFHPFRKGKSKKWYTSPHFHILAYGFLKQSEEIYAASGWIYKNLGSRDSVSKTISYLLGHSGLAYYTSVDMRVFHSVTWFGALSYNKVVIDQKSTERVLQKCELCNEPLKRYPIKTDTDEPYVDWNNPIGDFYIQSIIIKYRLRKYEHKQDFIMKDVKGAKDV